MMPHLARVEAPPDTKGTVMAENDGVLDKLLDIFDMVAPEGMLDAYDRDDRLAVIEGVGQVKIALYRLFERSEKRGNMPRWVRSGNGRMTLDLAAEKTPDEQAESDARAREMGPSGVAPYTPRWDSSSTCKTTGFSKAQAEFLFPTKDRWDGFLKATGKVEVGGADLKSGNGGGIARPTAPKTTAAREEREETAAELLKKVLAKMEQGVPADAIASIVPSAARNGTNGKNGVHKSPEPDSILREIEGEGGLDEDPSAVLEEIPVEQRAPVDTGNFDKRLWNHAVSRAMERNAAVAPR